VRDLRFSARRTWEGEAPAEPRLPFPSELTPASQSSPPAFPPDGPHPKKLITDDCIQPRPLALE